MITQLFTGSRKKGLMTTAYDYRKAQSESNTSLILLQSKTFLCCALHTKEMVPLTTLSPTCDCMTTNLPSATKLYLWQLHYLRWVVCLTAHGVVPADLLLWHQRWETAIKQLMKPNSQTFCCAYRQLSA